MERKTTKKDHKKPIRTGNQSKHQKSVGKPHPKKFKGVSKTSQNKTELLVTIKNDRVFKQKSSDIKSFSTIGKKTVTSKPYHSSRSGTTSTKPNRARSSTTDKIRKP